MKIAAALADKPRMALVTLKQHLTRRIREELPAYIDEELRMHNLTIAQPEVRRRIEQLYGG